MSEIKTFCCGDPAMSQESREAIAAVIEAAAEHFMTPTPEEAELWEPHYVFAHEVKVGDYLVDMGTFQKVYRVTTFEPYDSVQIKAGKVNYSKRKTDGVWVLQKPEGA